MDERRTTPQRHRHEAHGHGRARRQERKKEEEEEKEIMRRMPCGFDGGYMVPSSCADGCTLRCAFVWCHADQMMHNMRGEKQRE